MIEDTQKYDFWGALRRPEHYMEPAEIRHYTPMTERLVSHLITLQRPYDDAGLYYVNNVTAYRWRMFELRLPWLAKLAAVFRWGPRIALGV